MIRLFLILTLVSALLFSKTSVDANIKQTTTKLSSFSKNYTNINKKMAETAEAILKQKKEIEIQQKHLDTLKEELSLKESSYKENTIQLKDLKEVQSNLKSTQEKLEEELVFTIAQSVSLSIILEEIGRAHV